MRSAGNELPRILFVGGDFVRKGGDSLLKVFRERLRHKAELVLVTRAHVAEEPGVRVYPYARAQLAGPARALSRRRHLCPTHPG